MIRAVILLNPLFGRPNRWSVLGRLDEVKRARIKGFLNRSTWLDGLR
jgi:hypothetical protein